MLQYNPKLKKPLDYIIVQTDHLDLLSQPFVDFPRPLACLQTEF